MKFLGFVLIVSSVLLSACTQSGGNADTVVHYYSSPMVDEMDDSVVSDLLADITPKILNRDTDYLLTLMPSIDGFDSEQRLEDNISQIFLNLGWEGLEENPEYTTRLLSAHGSNLPKTEVSGYYEITKGGTLWFSYSFLYQDNERKWAGFSFDVVRKVDASDYDVLFDATKGFVSTVHEELGKGELAVMYSLTAHSRLNAADYNKFEDDFDYILEGITSHSGVFAPLELNTLQIKQFDGIMSPMTENQEVFYVHGSVLNQSGAYLIFRLGLAPQDDGTYELFDLLNYDRALQS